MILLPSTRPRIANVPFLFRADDCLDEDGLFALSYGRRVSGVFARTGHATLVDQNGRLLRAASGQPRVQTVQSAGGLLQSALLLERASTNLLLRSQEFDHASWVDINAGTTVVPNVAVAPDGSLTMDHIFGDGTIGSQGKYQSVSFTGDGEKVFSVFLREGEGVTPVHLSIYDATAVVERHRVRVAWTAGVPAVTTVSGAGTAFPVEWHLNRGWRVAFSATGVVAANTNLALIYTADNTAAAGSVHAWGAQAENSNVPTSYIPTAGSTVTRAADSLYFPYSAPPQELTAYVRGLAQHTFNGPTTRLLHLGAASLASDPFFSMGAQASASSPFSQYDSGASVQTASALPIDPITRGMQVELRGRITSTFAPRISVAVDGGAEVAGSNPIAAGEASAWAAERLYLTGGLSSNNNPFAYTHVVVALGERSMAEMRELAGVG